MKTKDISLINIFFFYIHFGSLNVHNSREKQRNWAIVTSRFVLSKSTEHKRGDVQILPVSVYHGWHLHFSKKNASGALISQPRGGCSQTRSCNCHSPLGQVLCIPLHQTELLLSKPVYDFPPKTLCRGLSMPII